MFKKARPQKRAFLLLQTDDKHPGLVSPILHTPASAAAWGDWHAQAMADCFAGCHSHGDDCGSDDRLRWIRDDDASRYANPGFQPERFSGHNLTDGWGGGTIRERDGKRGKRIRRSGDGD